MLISSHHAVEMKALNEEGIAKLLPTKETLSERSVVRDRHMGRFDAYAITSKSLIPPLRAAFFFFALCNSSVIREFVVAFKSIRL